MYNRYIPDSTVYRPIPEEDGTKARRPPPPPSSPSGGTVGRSGRLLSHFHFNGLDSGDLLLLLILLLLLQEGEDNLEVLIALGLLLLSGLFGGQDTSTT